MQSTPSFFRALADRTRLRIVNLLAGGPLCVCDIQRLLGQPQSSVSRHLSHLRSSGLVRDRRNGMRTFYALTQWDGGLRRRVLDALRRELKTEAEHQRDLDKLAALKAAGECHRESALAPRSRARLQTADLGSAFRPARPTVATRRAHVSGALRLTKSGSRASTS